MSETTIPVIKKQKMKILPAKRKHRFELKAINEKCLPENYDISVWDTFISFHNSFVLYADSLVVGYCIGGKEGEIYSFAILEEYRGKGYGKKLLNTAIEHFVKKGIKKVSLNVRVSNNIAISLYKSLGFSINMTLDCYYGNEDAYEMVKGF